MKVCPWCKKPVPEGINQLYRYMEEFSSFVTQALATPQKTAILREILDKLRIESAVDVFSDKQINELTGAGDGMKDLRRFEVIHYVLEGHNVTPSLFKNVSPTDLENWKRRWGGALG